jgi:hypothetical protein
VTVPVFTNPYPGGWHNLPTTDTPIMAAVLTSYESYFQQMTAYLQTAPWGAIGGGTAGLAYTKSYGYAVNGHATDYPVNGSNDCTQFKAAIDAIKALYPSGGGKLLVTPGTYIGTGAFLSGAAGFLVQDCVNMELYATPGAVFKRTAGADINLFHFQHNTGVQLTGRWEFDGNMGVETSPAVPPSHGANFYGIGNGSVGNVDCLFEKIHSHHAWQHNFILKETGGQHQNITVRDLWTHNAGIISSVDSKGIGSGSYFYLVDGLQVDRIRTHDNSLDGFQTKLCTEVQFGKIISYNNLRYNVYKQGGLWQGSQIISRGGGNIGVFFEPGSDAATNPERTRIMQLDSFSNSADGVRIHNVSNVSICQLNSYNNSGGAGSGLRITADTGVTMSHIHVLEANLYDDQVSNTQTNGLYCTGAGSISGDIKIAVGRTDGNTRAVFLDTAWDNANTPPMMVDSSRLVEMHLPQSALVALPEARRVVTDGVITSTTNFASATAAFTGADTGDVITGANIPAGTTMTYVNATNVTLSQAATNGTGLTATIWGAYPNRANFDGVVLAVGAELAPTGGTLAGGAGIVANNDVEYYVQ